MISKQKQIGVLRSLIIKELKREKVKERMISTLKGNKNVGKGNLLAALERFNYNNALRISNTQFDEFTGAIIYFDLSFDIRLSKAAYGLLLDYEQEKEITSEQYARIKYGSRGNKIRKLMSWIRTKNPSTWRNPVSIDLSKEYKVKRLAVAIANKHLSNPDRSTDNKTNYLSNALKSSDAAIDRAMSRFVDYWSDEFVVEFQEGIIKLNVL